MAFQNLLRNSAGAHDMIVVAEVTEKSEKGNKNVRYDGKVTRRGKTMEDGIIPHGYWEAKDDQDSLLHEVIKKREAGYKFFNIIFEDTRNLILYQDEKQVFQCSLLDENDLAKGLELFYGYRNKYQEHFTQALAAFKEAIPALAKDLHGKIERLEREETGFRDSCGEILKSFQQYNHGISMADVHEFMVQHTLTIDLFHTIFQANDFEKLNPIAKRLDDLVLKALKRQKQRIEDKSHNLLDSLKSVILQGYATPGDKQQILIAVYEEFFKAYNPKKADTHGVVYTPRPVVDFMVRSCDELMHHHFGKRIYSDGVRILDPCTGTGTFVCSLLDYIPQQHLERKFDDIYAIEVDLMAYYMAQLNIEDCYREKMGQKYIERSYTKLALADSLEIGTVHKDAKQDLFASYAGVTDQNAKLVEELQSSDYLLVIGNPPYNANQGNENENNRNKRYQAIDQRNTETYKKNSNAQKMKLTDMYIRFMRWASDKLLFKHTGEESGAAKEAVEGAAEINGKGAMLCFVTNRSYIDKLFTDGMRKTWAAEWDHIYVVDLLSDVRSNPKIAGTTHNVFGIQTGVAICCLVKDDFSSKDSKVAEIWYGCVPSDFMLKGEKLDWLKGEQSIAAMKAAGRLERVLPDEKGHWLRQGEKDFGGFISIGNKEFKAGKTKTGNKPEPAVFQLYSLGVATNRDEWVYSHSKKELAAKMQIFIERYEEKRKAYAELSDKEKAALKGKDNYAKLKEFIGDEIKWSDELATGNIMRGDTLEFQEKLLIQSLYRPFVKKWLYYDTESSITHRKYQTQNIFGATGTLKNVCIVVNNPNAKDFQGPLIINNIIDLNSMYGGTQIFPRYRYAPHRREDIRNGSIPQKIDNIPDEALTHFNTELAKHNAKLFDGSTEQQKTEAKDTVFTYCYGLLHQESYRKKYADNLRQELPRIPVSKDFRQVAATGQKLINLHLSWDTDQCPRNHYQLSDTNLQRPAKAPATVKYSPSGVKDKQTGRHSGEIKISNALSLVNVPPQAWQYTLGGRAAIDWVLEFYKESKNTYKDAALAELVATGKLDPYRLSDYEETLLDTLTRVINVSCTHMEIVKELS
ncbi:N-6 DNA methylase [Candidatus Haliotispira prima]|uniref:site-specific DNA-methyltransferase (adenine-specific) n=1 Tax=Candidatus Haliotispira prima TaxID=3034016 RepID=A0ABY8MMD6_9SPIO|nr:N-6 DNA methylase [Candidatus Haliotispira prima]